MGERLQDLEERLEQLVPRGLSDEGQARLEDEIDKLAEAVEQAPVGRGGGMVAGIAAACVLGAVVVFFPRPVDERAATGEAEETFPVVEYLASQVKVTEMTDDGWDLENGAERPHRYWINMVTETEDLLDIESGYQVQVVSEREVVVPVLLTHL